MTKIVENYYGEDLKELIDFFKLPLKGVLHVGAHKCEEFPVYSQYTSNITWIEGLDFLIKENLQSNPNLHIIKATVSDQDGKEVEFKVSNVTNCSSILNFKKHLEVHPEITTEKTVKTTTTTLSTLFATHNLSGKYNLLVLDIQGAELLALHGLQEYINEFDYVYTEVNEWEMYEGCCTLLELDNYFSKFNFTRKYLHTLNGYGNALYTR
jgi:FkbM family methyltransferase